MIDYLGYFTLNFIIELLLACLCLPTCKFRRLLIVILTLNLVTHPALCFLLSHAYTDFWPKFLGGEALVFIVEIHLGLLLLGRYVASKARIIMTVLACNLFSFAFTFII